MTVSPLKDNADQLELSALINTAAEHALLGALMIDNRVYDRVIDLVHANDFSNAVHARIFAAIGTLIDRNQQANPVTLKVVFDRDDGLAEVGGAKYLAQLVTSAVTLIGAEDYARHIADLGRRRRIVIAAREAIADATNIDLERSALDILSDFDQCLLDIGEHGGQTWIPMSEASHQALLAAEKVHQAEGQLTGITTGLRDLDRRLGGLHGGDLIVIAGRPGMAKTALAVNIAFAAAKEAKKRPYIFSLEMSALDIAARIMAKDSGISSEKQRIGPIDKHEIHLLFDSQLRIANLPIAIDDGMAVSVAQIRARARAYKRRHGLDMMIVDYLQLMHSDRRRGGENRVQEISEMTRALKTMAVELGFRSFSSRN